MKMRQLLKNQTFQHQVAQGVIVASVLGAVLALGTSCAPVANSISKVPNPKHTLRDIEHGNDTLIGHTETRVVPASEVALAADSLPEGLKLYLPTADERADFLSTGSAKLRLPGVNGSLDLYVVIEVSLDADHLKKRGLQRVETRWLVVNPKLADIVLSIPDEDGDQGARRRALLDVAEGFRVYYRELR